MITRDCPNCNRPLSLPIKHALAKRGTCPRCNAQVSLSALDWAPGHAEIKTRLLSWGDRAEKSGTFQKADGRDLRHPKDLLPYLANAAERSVLLIQNLIPLREEVAEYFHSAVREFRIDIVLGEVGSVRTINLHLKPFTLIATSDNDSRLTPGLQSCFNVCPFSLYEPSDLSTILLQRAKSDHYRIDEAAAELIAEHSHGRSDVALNYVSHARTLSADDHISFDTASKALAERIVNYRPQHFESDSRKKSQSHTPSSLRSLSPREFEQLIADLVHRMGFAARLTKPTSDGGIDVVASSRHPLTGGTFVLQCKRYGPENPVGVQLVRELMGVVDRERATRGVLITTSTSRSCPVIIW